MSACLSILRLLLLALVPKESTHRIETQAQGNRNLQGGVCWLASSSEIMTCPEVMKLLAGRTGSVCTTLLLLMKDVPD